MSDCFEEEVTYHTEAEVCATIEALSTLSDLCEGLLRGAIEHLPLRRLTWFILLDALPGCSGVIETPQAFAEGVARARRHYATLHSSHETVLAAGALKGLDPNVFHPLSNAAENPWKKKHEDEELLNEIDKDVDRTFPERELFNRPDVRQSLRRILFTWSKDHSKVSYRQGMNEVLGLIYAACYRHQCDKEEKGFGSFLCSGEAIVLEADAYTLFNALMSKGLMTMFTPAAAVSGSASREDPLRPRRLTPGGQASVCVARSDYIFHSLLRKLDSDLYNHLVSVSVEPQLFLLRWMRLLFSREFRLDDALEVWDVLFADAAAQKVTQSHKRAAGSGESGVGPLGAIERPPIPEAFREASTALPLVDFFAIGMLSYIRSNLLSMDMSGCLKRLMRFPPLESVHPVTQLALAARRSYLNPQHPPARPSFARPNTASSNTSLRSLSGDPLDSGDARTKEGRSSQSTLPPMPWETGDTSRTPPAKSKDRVVDRGFSRNERSQSPHTSSSLPTISAMGEDIMAMRHRLLDVKGAVASSSGVATAIQSVITQLEKLHTNLLRHTEGSISREPTLGGEALSSTARSADPGPSDGVGSGDASAPQISNPLRVSPPMANSAPTTSTAAHPLHRRQPSQKSRALLNSLLGPTGGDTDEDSLTKQRAKKNAFLLQDDDDDRNLGPLPSNLAHLATESPTSPGSAPREPTIFDGGEQMAFPGTAPSTSDGDIPVVQQPGGLSKPSGAGRIVAAPPIVVLDTSQEEKSHEEHEPEQQRSADASNAIQSLDESF